MRNLKSLHEEAAQPVNLWQTLGVYLILSGPSVHSTPGPDKDQDCEAGPVLVAFGECSFESWTVQVMHCPNPTAGTPYPSIPHYHQGLPLSETVKVCSCRCFGVDPCSPDPNSPFQTSKPLESNISHQIFENWYLVLLINHFWTVQSSM